MTQPPDQSQATGVRGAIRLGRIAGIDIGVHYTWLLAFVLITWSLASGYFPANFKHWSPITYWLTGILASILLFASVLTHELAHSIVAKSRGIPVRSIILFIFGGVSNIESEPDKPGDEFTMAGVGPLTSLALALIFWGLAALVGDRQSPLAAMLTYLALINAILAVFNILPGLPLDGGRVLRAIVWRVTGSLTRATNIAAMVGHILAWLLIIAGFFEFIGGSFLNGLWTTFIGWFLNTAAESSRGATILRQHLSGVKVRDVMNPNLEIVSPSMSVADLVREIFLQHGRRVVAVGHESSLLGVVTPSDVRQLPQELWSQTSVERIMRREPFPGVSIDEDLNVALKLLTEHNLDQLLVLENGQLRGLLGRGDIIHYLQISQELGLRAK
jgi:Zn-dependent protease